MNFVIILIFILLFLFSFIIVKNKISLFFLKNYLGWWFLLCIISTFNPYDLYAVSDKIYLILIGSIILFYLGFLLNEVVENDKKSLKKVNINDKEILLAINSLKKNKLFTVLLVLFSILIGNYLIKYQQYVFIFGPEEARTMRFFIGPIFKNSAEIFFYNFFVESFSVLVSMFFSISLVWKKFSKTFFLSIIFIYLYSSFGAGRFYIIEMVFYILFFFFIKVKVTNKKNTIKEKKEKMKLLFIIIPFLLGSYIYSIYLLNFRSGVYVLNLENVLKGNDEFMKQIVVYCIGSFRALEYGINNISSNLDYTLGTLSFGGLEEIFGVFLNAIGIKYKYSNLLYGEHTYASIDIGLNQSYNALYTNVFVQYLDFGILGIVIFSLFWGNIFSKTIHYYYRTNSVYILMILAYFFSTSILSALKWKLQSPSAWIFILVILFIHKFISSKSKNLDKD